MANRHFGKFADVWKHLVVSEALDDVRPARYAETHAGSAAYPLVDDAERRFGVLGYLDGIRGPLLSSPFTRIVSRFANAEPALYPGSALQAMTLLGDDSTYLLCDLDPASVADLRSWATRLGLTDCEVVQRDGMATVRDRLPHEAATVVHIDPFDPFGHEDGVPSAVELAAEVAQSGHTLVYWYGYSAPAERAWAVEEIQRGTTARLWWGDVMVTGQDGRVRDDGDLGGATTAGTGCGVVLANVPDTLVDRCQVLGRALVRAYEGKPLPDGRPGRLDLATTPSA
jgi:23S rRNA A2030 N6-methylase RlmJ